MGATGLASYGSPARGLSNNARLAISILGSEYAHKVFEPCRGWHRGGGPDEWLRILVMLGVVSRPRDWLVLHRGRPTASSVLLVRRFALSSWARITENSR